jgi:hypothetical protein
VSLGQLALLAKEASQAQPDSTAQAFEVLRREGPVWFRSGHACHTNPRTAPISPSVSPWEGVHTLWFAQCLCL